MYQHYFACPRHDIQIDAAQPIGALETWRHSLGQGGVNHMPLPEHVVAAVARLSPRLIRIFIQESFDIYPAAGQFDWTRLDPYMDALARTGAHVVAAICIKPRVLFPRIDQSVWTPNDVPAWQNVLAKMVHRYSVERPIVTHWEIGNETDIGEHGGCPYLIKDPADYYQYYRMAIDPIRQAFPTARIGGPAACWVDNQPLPGLLELCRRDGTQLDFVSWHVYHDDPARHAAGVAKAKVMLAHHQSGRVVGGLAGFSGPRPEMMVTEMNKSFDPLSLAELAFEPRRAAAVAAGILAMLEAGLDWSFYYHIWDQTFLRKEFERFFAQPDPIMTQHWNEIPHRFGLFGVNGEVRPQYFLYWMLARLGSGRLAGQSDNPDLRILAGREGGRLSLMLVNYNLQSSIDRVATVRFTGLGPGRKMLTHHRIDAQCRWDQALELAPVERREIDTPQEYRCQLFCPADSVTLLSLE